MHPDQAAAIEIVSSGVDRLASALVGHCNLCEDDALEIVRNLPDLVTAIQAKDFDKLVTEGVRRAKRIPKPKYLRFDAPDPDELYPGHPDFRAKVTTPTTFNEHAAQAMSPYIEAILKRIAKDRNLEPPDTHTVNAVVNNINWSKAAYEARKMPEKPSTSQLKAFFRRLWQPVEDIANSTSFNWFWYAIIGTTVFWGLWHGLRNKVVPANTDVMTKMAISGLDRHAKWSRKRVERRAMR
jgi:hypothetical protein